MLEYNIILPAIEKTGKGRAVITEQIISTVMASDRDFENVTWVSSCNLYVLQRIP